MGVAPLLVDAGEVTIMFSLAAFTWGKWEETWPEGATKPELPQGRVLGYVGALRNKPKGRFSYRFVRGDVSVNAVDHVSTVEQTLDEAAKRVEGDLFVEQDISLPGLGLMRPGVDFSVGDVVPIRVWGRVLRLPVTSVEAVTGDSGVVVDWRVHVGGQLVLNRDAVRATNDSLLRTIAQERRERRGAVAGVLEAAKSDAKAKADKALSDAKTYAGGLVTPVATRLDQLGQDFKTQTGRVDTLTTSQEGTASKLQAVVNGDPGGLLTGTAFEKNQRAINELQAAFNAEQVGINTGFRKLFNNLEKADRVLEYQQRLAAIYAQSRAAQKLNIQGTFYQSSWVPTESFKEITPIKTSKEGSSQPVGSYRCVLVQDGIKKYSFEVIMPNDSVNLDGATFLGKVRVSAWKKPPKNFAVLEAVMYSGSFSQFGAEMTGREESGESTLYVPFESDDFAEMLKTYDTMSVTTDVLMLPHYTLPFYERQIDALNREFSDLF